MKILTFESRFIKNKITNAEKLYTMKKNLLVTKLILIIAVISANAQVIPNYNFESWTNGANAAPDGWRDRGNIHPGFHPVTQSTEHSMGNYSVRLESKVDSNGTTIASMEMMYPGSGQGLRPVFPVSTAYTTLKGFYKYLQQGGDSAQFVVALFKTGYVNTQSLGNLLAFGLVTLDMAPTFTPFSTPAFYYDGVATPDSAYLSIAAYKSVDITNPGVELPVLGNSVLYVDALNFDTLIAGIDNPQDITNKFSLFPNAGSGDFNLSFETVKNDFTTIRVYDLAGKEVKNLFAANLTSGVHTFQYSINDLESSAYLLVVATGSGYKAEKIYITR